MDAFNVNRIRAGSEENVQIFEKNVSDGIAHPCSAEGRFRQRGCIDNAVPRIVNDYFVTRSVVTGDMDAALDSVERTALYRS